MSEDIQSLVRRTQAGDAGAMAALGKRLLFGEGVTPSPNQGASLLAEAMERSNAEATALVARLAAWGVLRPRDLELALDLMARSAALGWRLAQEELRFLARRDGAVQVS